MDFLPDTSFRDLPAPMRRDYFRSPRGMGRWLRLLIWLGLFGSLAFVGYAFLPGQQKVFQAGPLTSAHQMFANDCAQCHTGSFEPLARLVSVSADHRSTPDEACIRCHAGPRHQKEISAQNCAACHREHHGRDALLKIADAHCVACHRDLKGHPESPSKLSFASSIVDFASHPEFALIEKKSPDEGTVFFNHAKHMNLDGVLPDHRALKDRGCAYCHQPDQAGKGMKPIRYQDHCQQCHPLRVALHNPNKSMAVEEVSLREFGRSLAHPGAGESAEVVRAALRERLTQIVQTRPEILQAEANSPALVPRDLTPSPRPAPLPESAAAWVHAQQLQGERILFDGPGGCQQCHQEKTSFAKRPGGLPDYGKPFIPSRWMHHAVFDHQAHRFLDCLVCHEKARESGKATNAVMMPSIDTCKACHQNGGGARSDCVECHLFHGPGGHADFRGALDLYQLNRSRKR